MNKKTMFTTVAVTVIGAGLLTASSAFAQNTSDQQDPMASLVKKISQKFNLNESDVQKVFDEAHKERHAQMQAAFEEQLSQYVTDGKITEEQRQRILEKRKELDAEREKNKDSFKNLTPEQRRTQMESKKTELDAWSKENSIDIQYLMPRRGKGPMGGRGDFGQRNDDQNAPASPTTNQ